MVTLTMNIKNLAGTGNIYTQSIEDPPDLYTFTMPANHELYIGKLNFVTTGATTNVNNTTANPCLFIDFNRYTWSAKKMTPSTLMFGFYLPKSEVLASGYSLDEVVTMLNDTLDNVYVTFSNQSVVYPYDDSVNGNTMITYLTSEDTDTHYWIYLRVFNVPVTDAIHIVTIVSNANPSEIFTKSVRYYGGYGEVPWDYYAYTEENQ